MKIDKASSAGDIELLISDIRNSFKERDWEQYHSPKNVAMSLSVEASELLEHFTWLSESESANLSKDKKQEVTDEIGDIMINLLYISDLLDIDLLSATKQKFQKVKEKYPVGKSKGKNLKYSAYWEYSNNCVI